MIMMILKLANRVNHCEAKL